MKKITKLIAPLAMSCTMLAACGQQARIEWKELAKSVDVYEDIIKEHRISSTNVKAHINKIKVVGSGKFTEAGIEFNNEEINIGEQDLAEVELPISSINQIFELVNNIGKSKMYLQENSKATGKAGKKSLLSFIPYALKLPVTDYVVMLFDGFTINQGSEEASIYERMTPMQWKNLVPTYSFDGNGDSKKLSKIKFEVKSVKELINEYSDRSGGDRPKVEGDATASGELNVDTNTGYIKDLSLKFNAPSLKYVKTDTWGDTVSIDGSIDIDVKLELTHNDAEKVNIKYQTIEYIPTLTKGTGEEGNTYTFQNGNTKVTQYDSLDKLALATGIKANWYFNDHQYDDPVKNRDYFLTDETSKNVGYEGYDYDVYFTQDSQKYGFVLNSDANYGNNELGENASLKEIKKDENSYKCSDLTKATLKRGSTVRYNSIDISSDTADRYATANDGYSAYFGYVESYYDSTAEKQYKNVPTVHIFGSDLYNSKGTYVVTLGIYKLNQD